MKRFIVLYHANAESMAEMAKQGNPEERQESMKKWMQWAQKCGNALVDMGKPLGNGKKIDGSASNKGIVGYSILQAQDMDGALALVKDHPHTSWNAGCSIEVHEEMPLPGM
jgi:hypothetical protein